MKRLFKNDGTLLFGYWIHTRYTNVPQSYLRWGCENVPNFDLQLERLKQGLEPIPSLKDGTKALPVMSPPVRKTFTSRTVRHVNHTTAPPSSAALINLCPIEQAIKDGFSRRQIADKLGMSKVTLDKHIRDLGLPKPVDGRRKNRVSAEISQMSREALKAKAKQRRQAILPAKDPQRLSWSKSAAQIKAMRDKGLGWDDIATEIGFLPGGIVLRSRYNVHCCTSKSRNPTIKATAARPGLLRRLWNALFNITDRS